MRAISTLILSALIIAGCGGGGSDGSSKPEAVPIGTVSGITFDGLVLYGTVSVYDFSNGSKGALLATATTNGDGLYTMSLQVESRPVWIELTGGYYAEEADLISVTLQNSHKLVAVANYKTGSALNVAVTTYSYAAAGLAQYQVAHGTPVTTAIDNANTRISNLVGVNVLTTIPKQITSVGSANATLTPELKYGFLAGAISNWTNSHALRLNNGEDRRAPYTSIDFAQLLYQDIVSDGLLDGIGLDNSGTPTQLAFGTTPLDANVYRFGIGKSLIIMGASTNNKTGLDGSKLLPFATAYIGNSDPIFNNVEPAVLGAATTVINSPADNTWQIGTVSLEATAQSPFGVKEVEFLLDDLVVSTSPNQDANQVFQIDTTKYKDGAHTAIVRMTDEGGQVVSATMQVNFDNSAPSSTGATVPGNNAVPSNLAVTSGCVSDAGAGVLSVTDVVYGMTLPLSAQGCWSTSHTLFANNPLKFPFVVKDKTNHCTNYLVDLTTNSEWALISSGICS